MASAAQEGAAAISYPNTKEEILGQLQEKAKLAFDQGIFATPQYNIECEIAEKSNIIDCDADKPTDPLRNNLETLCQQYDCGRCSELRRERFGGNTYRNSFSCEISPRASN
ncbi:hypothetical protein J3459_019425 [Metarhizium acridum]|nr:hypothetical protein J3459_019425 [Metarhizium acridum]